MKIVHVTQPTQAGVGTVVASLAAHHASSGHETSLVCPTAEVADGPLRTLVDAGAVRAVDWPARRSPGPSTLQEARRLGRLLGELDPDVVFLHSAKAGLAGRLALRGTRTTVFVPHAWSFEAAVGLTRRAARRWEILAQRWSQVTVCVSAEEKQRGCDSGLPGGRMVVIPNGIDVDRFPAGSTHDARAALGLRDVPTVVCVGRLTQQKGQDRLLAAWPLVRERLPTADLVLVGDGPDREELEGRAVPGVLFVGDTPDPGPYFLAADVVAFPSRWEAGPLVPLEAMASGRSVVSVDVTGARAVLGDWGTVVPNRDDDDAIRQLADAILTRLLDPAATAAQGDIARCEVTSRFSLRQSLLQWDRLLGRMAP